MGEGGGKVRKEKVEVVVKIEDVGVLMNMRK